MLVFLNLYICIKSEWMNAWGPNTKASMCENLSCCEKWGEEYNLETDNPQRNEWMCNKTVVKLFSPRSDGRAFGN